MNGLLKLQIPERITEQFLIEYCLNLYYSKYEYKFALGFYAFAKGWKYDKLIYYVNLIEGGQTK